MLYSFYEVNNNVTADIRLPEPLAADDITNEINDSIDKICHEVIAFLFESDIAKSAGNISDIMEECEELNQCYSPSFIDKMNETYSKVEKTVSGKAMPDNVLLKLFQEVMHLRQEV